MITLTRSTPMRRTAFKRKPLGQREPILKSSKQMKSRGAKGRTPTADEKRTMHAIGGLGCIACRHDGIENPFISLHHIDGRTKPGAHARILPLCAPHHQQDDTDPLQRPSVHGRKASFEARYGTEQDLLAECMELIREPA